MSNLKARKKDVRKVLDVKPSTEHNGLEKLYGLFLKKFKIGK